MGSLSPEVLAQVATLTTLGAGWAAINSLFAAETQAQAVNTRIALVNLKKGLATMADYLALIKAHADESALTGTPLSDHEVVSYVVTGLDMEYNSVVSALTARVEPVTPTELFSHLLSFEARLN